MESRPSLYALAFRGPPSLSLSSAFPPLPPLGRFSGATLPSIFSSSSTIACFLKLEEEEGLSCARAECVRRSHLSPMVLPVTWDIYFCIHHTGKSISKDDI